MAPEPVRVSSPMGDFHQGGVITTLHRLGRSDLNRLEGELLQYASERPIALVLPCLFSELRGPALKGIVDALRGVHYLEQIVVSISGSDDRADYEEMRALFEGVETRSGHAPVLLWNSGRRVQGLLQALRDEGLDPGSDGKGRAIWLANGYVLASNQARVIAVHDCDILNYSREMLARLCYPTAQSQPPLRIRQGLLRSGDRSSQWKGDPFVRGASAEALKSVLGPQPLLEYLDSFRYLLAGESSMTTELARINRIPSDWGLEIGMLGEVYRNCSPKRVCQVEIADNYDHKHRELSENDTTQGLSRMVVDIALSLIHNLASYGVEFDAGFLNTLTAAYTRTAQDAIASFNDDAAQTSGPSAEAPRTNGSPFH